MVVNVNSRAGNFFQISFYLPTCTSGAMVGYLAKLTLWSISFIKIRNTWAARRRSELHDWKFRWHRDQLIVVDDGAAAVVSHEGDLMYPDPINEANPLMPMQIPFYKLRSLTPIQRWLVSKPKKNRWWLYEKSLSQRTDKGLDIWLFTQLSVSQSAVRYSSTPLLRYVLISWSSDASISRVLNFVQNRRVRRSKHNKWWR